MASDLITNLDNASFDATISSSTVPVLVDFWATWCGPCKRLKSDLEKSGIPFIQIDIESDETAAALIETINNGNRTVPTLVFADGTSMTNPSVAKVKEHLGL